MKCRAVILVALATMVSGCSYFRTQSALDLYLKGQLEAEKGNLPVALNRLSDAIKKNPRMGMALLARGEIYKKQGNYEQAATDFKKVADQEPYNFAAHFELGVVYQYLKKFAEAVVAYQRAVEIRPMDNDANMNLALSYVQMGQPLQGLYYAQRAAQGNDASPAAHANLGMLYSQIGYTSAAIDELKKAVELDSKQPDVYVNLAQEYLTDKKYDQARNVLETARQLAPSAKVWDRLGFAYHMLRDDDKSATAFREALKVDPKYYPSLNGLGVLSMSKALSMTPTNVDLAKEAIAYWNRSLALSPDQESIKQLVNTYAPKQ